ncbi:XVIPCD domain-containing protein [Pseudomonas sp. CGJS7]|uniref:XVIPCD domain-containing protein n=1 Tax=Pseudomonas sp. CGJS7 TaxID=3109348 RepID=UPI00300B5340
MTALTPQAQALLTAFAARSDTSDAQAANLQALVDNSPTLIAQLNAAAAPPAYVRSIVPLTNPNAGGEYNGQSGELRLPLKILDTPASGAFNPGEASYVMGHELQHGANHAGMETERRAVYAEMTRIAQTRAPRDYTAPSETLLAANRRDEASAEVAGFNATVAAARHANPNATLADVYNANTRMQAYIDRSQNGPPYTYTIKPEFTLNADLTMSPTPANVEGMGKHFFDRPRSAPGGLGAQGASDYQNLYGAGAIAASAHYERHFNPPVAGATAPQMTFDMNRLKLNEATVEGVGIGLQTGQTLPYFNSSTQPPTRSQFDYVAPPQPAQPAQPAQPPPQPGAQPPGPAQPSQGSGAPQSHPTPIGPERAPAGLAPNHPDYALYQQIRGGVERLDAQHGRGYDDASERLTRAALARVKENGGGPIDHVVLSQDRSTLFLVKGGLDDPAQQRTALAVGEALQTPVAESQRRADAVPQAQEAAQVQRPEARALQH